MGNKAVFVDRDGTINVNVEYMDDPDDLKIYPGVIEGLKKFQEKGYKIIIITNQSGIARGYFSEETLKKIHEKLKSEFLKKDVKIDAIYYCPHHPDEKCNCRKPNTKLFEDAIKDFDIDTKKSFMIGDRMLDIEAGKKLGLTTILIPENKKKVEDEMKKSNVVPDFIFNNFYLGIKDIIKII